MRSNNTIFAVSWLAPFLLLVVGCVVHLDSIVVYNIYYVLSRYFLIFFWLDLLGKNAPLIHSWRVAHVTPRVFDSRYFDIFFSTRIFLIVSAVVIMTFRLILRYIIYREGGIVKGGGSSHVIFSYVYFFLVPP